MIYGNDSQRKLGASVLVRFRRGTTRSSVDTSEVPGKMTMYLKFNLRNNFQGYLHETK